VDTERENRKEGKIDNKKVRKLKYANEIKVKDNGRGRKELGRQDEIDMEKERNGNKVERGKFREKIEK
jgi:hypothetical protein